MSTKESFKRLFILILSIIGIVVTASIYAYVWVNIYHRGLMWRQKFTFKGHLLMVFVYFILLMLFSATYDGFKVGRNKPIDIVFSQFYTLIFVNLITYFQLSLMEVKLVSRGPIIIMTLVQLTINIIWTLVSNAIYRKLLPPRELMIIYGEHTIEEIEDKFSHRKDHFKIVESIHVSKGLEIIERRISLSNSAIVLWDVPTPIRNRLLKYCYSRSIRIYMVPKIPDVIVQGADRIHLFDTPIFLTREYALTIEQRCVKRVIDLVCAIILLIVAMPIMIITAIIIKVSDGGECLYKQIRCTEGGKQFNIIKFRSMKIDAEHDGVARLATKGDKRITPFGKFIRAVRIDELPQLLNIIKGDMSFIGPRPERPELIASYLKDMPEFAFRMKVKAGLAGYAQVYGKYNTTPYDKLKLDLTYIESYSVWLDIKLMLLTLKILFKPESTEGVDKNQISTSRQEAIIDNK